MGTISGNKNTFFRAVFIGDKVLANAFNGSFFLWELSADNIYKSTSVVHGHFAPVNDLSWDSSGKLLFSTSTDQTTRVLVKNTLGDWKEYSRPQTHGYDLNCISTIRRKEGLLDKIVSASEEKVLRVFDPPFNLVKFANLSCGLNYRFSEDKENAFYEQCRFLISRRERRKTAVGPNEQSKRRGRLRSFDLQP